MLLCLTSYFSPSQTGSNCRHSSVSVQKDTLSESLCGAKKEREPSKRVKTTQRCALVHASKSCQAAHACCSVKVPHPTLASAVSSSTTATSPDSSILRHRSEGVRIGYISATLRAIVPYFSWIAVMPPWNKEEILPCDKSGPNLVIYSKPSYKRSPGHSPKPHNTKQTERPLHQ